MRISVEEERGKKIKKGLAAVAALAAATASFLPSRPIIFLRGERIACRVVRFFRLAAQMLNIDVFDRAVREWVEETARKALFGRVDGIGQLFCRRSRRFSFGVWRQEKKNDGAGALERKERKKTIFKLTKSTRALFIGLLDIFRSKWAAKPSSSSSEWERARSSEACGGPEGEDLMSSWSSPAPAPRDAVASVSSSLYRPRLLPPPFPPPVPSWGYLALFPGFPSKSRSRGAGPSSLDEEGGSIGIKNGARVCQIDAFSLVLSSR